MVNFFGYSGLQLVDMFVAFGRDHLAIHQVDLVVLVSVCVASDTFARLAARDLILVTPALTIPAF